MTLTRTITTLAAIGTLVNAADVTTPDNELLQHINDLINGVASAEKFRMDAISTPSAPASGKFFIYPTTTGLKLMGSGGEESVIGMRVCNGRLTLQTGAPVTSADVTAATSLYFSPWLGNLVSIYNGTYWVNHMFSELTLSLSGLAANTNFDVFIYNSAGTLTLEAVAWTNDTTRATNLTTQDGVYVKFGATSRRYLGTFRTTSTIGQCEDSFQRRLVYNLYNKVERRMYFGEATSHAYTTATWRAWNNSTANQMEFVMGILENASIMVTVQGTWGTTNQAAVAAALNQASAPSLPLDVVAFDTSNSNLIKSNAKALLPILGYNYIRGYEFGNTSITFASIYMSAVSLN
jgi:hypothetical protein